MIDYEKLNEAFATIYEAFRPLMEEFKKAWNAFRTAAAEYFKSIEKKKKVNQVRSSWVVPRDTRLKSQVMMNKPKHMVRKVIR